MARGERRKCKSCLKLFRPDPRSRDRQQYCSAAFCKRASKAASQARWLAKPENQDYFRDPCHVARVRDWRARKGSSWRKPSRAGVALQDVRMPQHVDAVNHLIDARSQTGTAPDEKRKCGIQPAHQSLFTDVFRSRPLLCTIHPVPNFTPVRAERDCRALCA
jgi:hypothetical protein